MTQGKWWWGPGRAASSQEQTEWGWLDFGILSGMSSFLSANVSDLLSFSRKLHDPVEAVQLTGLSSGQPAVHPLSRLDRPTVTYSAVKPWARGFEMWQHNQFPWFMIILKRGCTERLGSWKRRAEGECWQQSQFTDMYSSRENLCFWLCWLLARDILFPLNVL